jgi:predicted ArsR family transcriptional regulator
MAEADNQRIDPNNDDDIRRWAKELGVENVAIIDAVKKVGTRVGDVRRHLDQLMAGGQADA